MTATRRRADVRRPFVRARVRRDRRRCGRRGRPAFGTRPCDADGEPPLRPPAPRRWASSRPLSRVTGKDFFPSAAYTTIDAADGTGPVHIGGAGTEPIDGLFGYVVLGASRAGATTRPRSR